MTLQAGGPVCAQSSRSTGPSEVAQDVRPRVLLIGTSNAVYAEGYAKVLADSDAFRSFENRSIGLASSALFCLKAATIDFSAYDICILDFCCNDASLFQSSYTSEDIMSAQIEEAFSVISRAGCVPVVLIFPIAKCLPDGGVVRQLYRRLADKHRVPVLDGYDLLAGIGAPHLPRHGLFADDMHLRLDVAQEVGRLLARSLGALGPIDRAGLSEGGVAGYAHRFLAAPELPSQPDDRLVLRETALTAAHCADWPRSDRTLVVHPDDEVVAVAANFAWSNCHLAIAGRSVTTIRLSSEHFRGDQGRLVLGIWTICPPVGADASTIRLSVGPDAPAGIMCGGGPLADGPPHASLVGLVLRRPARLSIRQFLPRAIDLTSGVDEDIVGRLVAIQAQAVTDQVIDGLYRGLLERPADPGGLVAYANLIRDHGLARGVALVATSIAASEEFKRVQGRA